MVCERCGSELSDDGRCPVCDATEKVRVMSREERLGYQGVTIEEGEPEEESDVRFERSGTWRRVRYTAAPGTSSWQSKAILMVSLIAVLAFLFFIALPAVLVLVVIGVLAWLFFQFFAL